MRTAVIALVLALAWLAAGSAQEPGAAAPTAIRGATLTTAEEPVAAGELARVRVRGEVLAALTSPDCQWQLKADGVALPATFVTPEPPGDLATSKLDAIAESEPGSAERWAVLDLGEPVPPLNRVELRFASPSVKGVARLELSADQQDYTPWGEAQVVWQEISEGEINRITTLSLPQPDRRYLRVRVNGINAPLTEVEGWSEPDDPREVYLLEAVPGAMRPGPEPGEHLWPLLLAENSAELVKLKVLADAPGEVRTMRVVRMHGENHAASTAGEGLWADRLAAGELTRSEKWINVGSRAGDPRSWGLIVVDGESPALQVTGIQAYAAEYWLYFTMPEGEAPRIELWLESAPADLAAGPEPDAEAAGLAGGFSELDLLRPVAEPVGNPYGLDWLDRLSPLLERWGRFSAYLLGGLVLLIISLLLLRRPVPDGQTED
ncbi:hypothetical protein JW859_02615 [bacterium]|nr:hypothetical protein [bacterium]